jgi:hypothetical protein
MMAPEMLIAYYAAELLVRMMSDKESDVQYCLHIDECPNIGK